VDTDNLDADKLEADNLGVGQFLPRFDIQEVHGAAVQAPIGRTVAAVYELDLEAVPLVRAIVKTRERILGTSKNAAPPQSGGFFSRMAAMGWGYLLENVDPETDPFCVVMGAITRPWEANVIFHPLPPAEFKAFADPGWVKIAWEIRVDARKSDTYVKTDTRALATDPPTRRRFRRYWLWVSPGVKLIRWAALRDLRHKLEKQ
jgi:hypothetical protein